VSKHKQRAASVAPFQRGSVLIEVMVAVVLIAVLLVPLANGMSSAIGRAGSLWDLAEEVGAGDNASRSGEAWQWGPAPTSVSWSPGPVLSVDVGQGGAEGRSVGIWVDGWFLGERYPDENGIVRLVRSELKGSIGAELVVRTRTADGGWGPPWRSLVPDDTGSVPGVSGEWSSVVDPTGSADLECSVVHLETVADPVVSASWAEGAVESDEPGSPVLLPEASPGACAVEVEGRQQSWRMEVGRAVDVYF